MPSRNFVEGLERKTREKVYKYLEFLRDRGGYLDEPYSRHIFGKIRELRVDFKNIRHRLFYFAFIGKKIVVLHGFIKKAPKMPESELRIAIKRYNDVINNPKLYE